MFNQNQDNFDNSLEKWLKITAELLKDQFPINDKRHINYMPFMQNISIKGICLQDFIKDVSIVLRDEFIGGITQISYDTLLIELPNDDIFRIKVIKDTNFEGFNELGRLGGFRRFGNFDEGFWDRY